MPVISPNSFPASVQGQRGTFLESGKEFEYDIQVMVGAGTMDYAPHIGGNVMKLNLKLQTTGPSVLTGKVQSNPLFSSNCPVFSITLI